MAARRFGAAGARVVIEERLAGEEASYYAITDGERVVTLAAAQDHKRALDGDRGENTGGMGAYAPAPLVTPAVEKRVLEEIVHPTLRGLAADGLPYRGRALRRAHDRCGRRAPGGRVQRALRRSGDAGADAAACDGDLVPLLAGAARGQLEPVSDADEGDAAVCVVLASGGYPRAFETGKPIEGIDEAERDPDVVVFHAGTQAPAGRAARDGRRARARRHGPRPPAWPTRAPPPTPPATASRFDGMQLRRDIGARAIPSLMREQAALLESAAAAVRGRTRRRVSDGDALRPRRRCRVGAGRGAAAGLEGTRDDAAAHDPGGGRRRAAHRSASRFRRLVARWPTRSGPDRSRWCCPRPRRFARGVGRADGGARCTLLVASAGPGAGRTARARRSRPSPRRVSTARESRRRAPAPRPARAAARARRRRCWWTRKTGRSRPARRAAWWT